MSLQRLPGFRDFLPEAFRFRNRIFETWRQTSERFGFWPYDGPLLEPLEMYTRKSGDEIVRQLYHFTDKGGREVSLRPEMTPTLARMAGAAHRNYKKPLKWYSMPQLFRYERPQKGRLREHFQWNCDILGDASVFADAELIALAIEGLRALGLSEKDFRVRLSDRSFWNQFLESHGAPPSGHGEFFSVLDRMEKVGVDKTREQLGDLAGAVFELVEKGARNGRMDALMQRLDNFGLSAFIEIDLGIVRGLAYYTGLVFEVHDRAGKLRAIAGGGRYDGLVKTIADVDLPAVGFGMGDVVLGEMLEERGLTKKQDPLLDYYIVIPDESVRAAAERLVMDLRRGGARVDYSLEAAKTARQFQAAEERGAHSVLIVDAAFERNGTLSIKNMETREQREAFVTTEKGCARITTR